MIERKGKHITKSQPHILVRAMRNFLLAALAGLIIMGSTAQAQVDYHKWAADWLYAARTGAPADSLQQLLAKADRAALKAALGSDDARKTFWINVYNAATQTTLKAAPDRYKSRSRFFKAKLVTIAGERLSLDNIEHGILRRSKNKLSFGYLNK